MKIGIWHHGGTKTQMGDRAILAAVLENISAGKNEPFLLCGNQKEMEDFYGVKTLPISPVSILVTIKSLRKIDVLIWGGGSILQDQSSVAYVIYQSIIPMLAKMLGKPVFCFGVGIGPLRTRIGRAVSRYVLSRCDIITVREENALKTIKSMGLLKSNVFLTEDPAVLLRGVGEKTAEKEELLIGLNCREWFSFNYSFFPKQICGIFKKKNKSAEQADLEDKFFKICVEIKKRYQNAEFILVPMYYGGRQKDEEVLGRLMSRLAAENISAELLDKSLGIYSIKRRLSGCGVFLGVRLHSMILAATEGVPITGINYLPKGRDFFKRLGMERFSHNIEDFRYEEVCKDIFYILENHDETANLMAKNLEKLRNSSKQTFRLLDKFCDSLDKKQGGGLGRDFVEGRENPGSV